MISDPYGVKIILYRGATKAPSLKSAHSAEASSWVLAPQIPTPCPMKARFIFLLVGVWKIFPIPWLVPKRAGRQERANCDCSTSDNDP